MDSGLARTQPHRRLLPLYMLYASLCCATLLFAIFIEKERLQDQFVADAKEVFRHADVKAKTFEICLDGFANYLGAQPSLDYDKAQRFAATIRSNYPELYMLELAELVHASERSSFEAKIRQRGYPNFSIHSFDHSGERIERPVPDAPYYFPITFVEPYRDDLATVLGLDLLYSSPELRNAVTDTTQSGRQQASQPFYLVEGGLGYLLHHPFTLAEEQEGRAYFALAVVRIADLFTPELLADPQWRVQVEHHQKELDISPRWEHTRTLSQRPGYPPWSLIPRGLATSSLGLPILEQHFRLTSPTQPLSLKLSYHPQLQDLDLRFISSIAALLLLCCFVCWRHLRQVRLHVEREFNFIEEMVDQAHFDSLTGLPNVNLLMDRLEQSIKRAYRRQEKFALCYLDLDQFKSINDRYGHDMGDLLLCAAAARMQDCLRESDTVSRIHGDEFIILMPAVAGAHQAEVALDKLRAQFEATIFINRTPLKVGVSLGFALYPDDGTDPEMLTRVADQRMYADKKTRSPHQPAA